MKKILIALPLVLIMILTMIPVMAAEGDVCEAKPVEIRIKVYNNPSEIDKPDDEVHPVIKTVTINPSLAVLQDAEKLEKEIRAEAAAVKKPHDRVAADAWHIVIAPEVKAVPEKETASEECPKDVIEYSVKVYPSCETKEDEPEETTCPVLCDMITIQAVNIADGKVVAEKGYGVKNKNNPSYTAMMNHFTSSVLDRGTYRIVENWFGQPWIDYPSLLEKCTITVRVLPLEQKVNVVHKLMTCCKNIDGTLGFSTWKTFVEQDQVVDFVDYHSKLVFDHSKAKEFAKTRLERINANDFVFIDAAFDDGIRLDGYMTGELFDIVDGKPVSAGTIKNASLPTIVLIYHHSDCVEQEEKVDNAQVNAGQATTNQAPAQQLPATGAKDVTAFFMSAVALLGLGIFFAKKH